MNPNPQQPRYLIGHGERLTKVESFVSSPKPDKHPVYSAEEVLSRLGPRLSRAVNTIAKAPKEALPQDRAVVMVTLHPEFLAKSSFPERLFGGLGLRSVGSRARRLEPGKWSKPLQQGDPKAPRSAETIDLYMAGETGAWSKWNGAISEGNSAAGLAERMGMIEDIRPIYDLNAEGRVKIDRQVRKSGVAEVAIHVPHGEEEKVFPVFVRFAAKLGVEIFVDLRIEVPGLCFVPVRGDAEAIKDLALFSFVRTIRPAVRLRALPSPKVTRSLGIPFVPPAEPPLNPAIRVAILDGGLPPDHGLGHVASYQAPGVSTAEPMFTDHGLAVTGALMYGSLAGVGKRPFGSVDHFRVLDEDDRTEGDVHAYKVLRRVQDVIETGPHDLYNLSLGPDIPVDDDEVHAWTSTLDALGADGERLIVAAAGNNGHLPEPLCRIQSPGMV